MVPLGEVVSFSSGGTPPRKRADYYSGRIPWITGADIREGGSIEPRSFITEEAVRRSATQVAPEGSIALVTRTSVGKVSQLAVPTAFSQDITVLQPRPGYDARYVMHFLRERAPFLRSEARGATIQGVTKSVVASLQLPDLDLAEQRRIAAILDHADALRAKRREQLAQIERLEAVIVDDMTRSSPLRLLGTVASLRGGASLPPSQPFVGQPGGALAMRVSDMNLAGNERSINRSADWTNAPTARAATVEAGAIVLPKRGASIATNKKRLTTRRTVLDPNLMGVQVDGAIVSSRLLMAWFLSFDLTTISSGSSVPQLNKKDLEPLEVPVPSDADRTRFEAALAHIDLAAERSRTSLVELDALFASLQHRAFHGEL